MWWLAREEGDPPDRSPAPVAVPAQPLAAGPAPTAAVAPEALAPAAHAGTDVDGALDRDADGRFAPTPAALRLFEYFFLARGEASEAEIVARIESEIATRLPASERPAALALLADYLEYRRRARELHESGAAPVDLERRLQWVRELRREVFGEAVADALFGEREAFDLAMLERRRILADASLTPGERRARLAAVEERMPEAARRGRERRMAPLDVDDEVEALRLEGADAAEIFAVREERFGTEAALRLEALDRQRADWQARLDAYRSERVALDASAADPDALEALRARHFAPEELARVRALDAEAIR